MTTSSNYPTLAFHKRRKRSRKKGIYGTIYNQTRILVNPEPSQKENLRSKRKRRYISSLNNNLEHKLSLVIKRPTRKLKSL